MPISLRTDSAERIIGNLRRVRSRLPRRLVTPGLRLVMLKAQRYALRDRSFMNRTFRLRNSIQVKQARTGLGQFTSGYELTAGGLRAAYARFIEFGTRFIRARRFIQRALRRVQREALGIVARYSRRNFDREVRRIIR